MEINSNGHHLDQFLESLSVVVGADFLAENAVEYQGNWVRHGEGDQHEKLGDPNRMSSDRQSKA